MTDQRCPKCGAERTTDASYVRIYKCMSAEAEKGGWVLEESPTCLRRQLAQKDEQLAAKQAVIEEARRIVPFVGMVIDAGQWHGGSGMWTIDAICQDGPPDDWEDIRDALLADDKEKT